MSPRLPLASVRRVLSVSILALLAGGVLAEPPASANPNLSPAIDHEAQIAESLARDDAAYARSLRDDADRIRAEAEERHANEAAACHTRVFVNACLTEARDRRLHSDNEARHLDLRAAEVERDLLGARIAEREARAAANRAEQEDAGTRHRSEEARRASERAARIADKERKAEENRRRLAEEAARREARRAARQQRIEERSGR